MLMDKTTFTTPRMRLELLMWASQNQLNAKRGEIKVFKGVALTDALPLSQRDLDRYTGTGRNTGDAQIGRYVIRVRIKDDLYEKSPHHYLPNPCNLDSTSNIAEAVKLIKLHTLCVTSADYQTSTDSPIRQNDIVEITLNMNGETNTVNSQHGIVTRLIERANLRDPKEPQCEPLSGKFLINTIARLKSYDPVQDEAAPGQRPDGGKCPATVPPGVLNFDSVTAKKPSGNYLAIGNNNYRYKQPTLGEIKYMVETDNITTFIRLNRDDLDSEYGWDPQMATCITMEIEEAYIEYLDKKTAGKKIEYKKMSAHQGCIKGQGFQESVSAFNKEFAKGNVLVHCKHGADRTGLAVAGWILHGKGGTYSSEIEGLSSTSKEDVWNYTTALNSWVKGPGYLCSQGQISFGRYLDSFWSVEDFCKSHAACAVCKKWSDPSTNVCKNYE